MGKRVKKCMVWLLILCCMTLAVSVPTDAKSLSNIIKSVQENLKQAKQSVTDTKKSAEEIDQAMGAGYTGKRTDITSFSSSSTPLVTPNAPSGTIGTGVDISKWNWTSKSIDFSKLSESVDFVIIRCADAISASNDPYFAKSIEECEKYEIPYGIYLFSRAENESEAEAEAKRTLKAMEKADANPTLPVFLDMEAESQGKIGSANLAKVAKKYCDTIEEAGYTTGIYSGASWWTNKLTNSYFKTKIKWIARYPNVKNFNCTYQDDYAMWQCNSDAKVDGITGYVDLNYMFQDIYTNLNLYANDYSGTYDGKEHSITVSNYKEGTKVQYSTDNLTWTTTNPVRIKAGTTKVYYKATNKAGKEVTGSAKIIIKTVKMSDVSVSSIGNQTYTGSQIKPSVTVKYNGKTLKKGTDYTVTYGVNKSVGTGSVRVTGIGNYSDSQKIIFHIVPKQVSGLSAYKGKIAKSAILKWNKATGATGYQVAYSRKGMNKWSYTTVEGTTKTFQGLTVKSYDVKVRAYKTVNGKKKYGSYSAVKAMTVK